MELDLTTDQIKDVIMVSLYHVLAALAFIVAYRSNALNKSWQSLSFFSSVKAHMSQYSCPL